MEQNINTGGSIIIAGKGENSFRQTGDAVGNSIVVYEWHGNGYDYLHVHYEDDEAFHILEGKVTFRFSSYNIEVIH